MKIFLWFFDLKIQTDQGNKKVWRNSCVSKEKHCCHNGLPPPKKRLSYGKCFVNPVVDSKVNPNFKELNGFRRGFSFRNRIHLKRLCKLHYFLGVLNSLPNRFLHSNFKLPGLIKNSGSLFQSWPEKSSTFDRDSMKVINMRY